MSDTEKTATIEYVPAAALEEKEFLERVAGFSSGSGILDAWLQDRGHRNARKGYTATVLAMSGGRVAGYFGLAAAAVPRVQLPKRQQWGTPEKIPVVLLGQLAVDRAFQGQGLGEALLLEALDRALQGSGRVGAAHILVDPLDDSAMSFYERYGFKALPGIEGKLPPMFLPMATVRRLLAPATSSRE